MIFDQSDRDDSDVTEALVPMVDLFAVLAIVFMIHASDEIIITKVESEKIIQEIEQRSEERIREIEEKIENDPQNMLAKKAEETLEEIKRKRAKKAEELVLAFSQMLEAQQDQAAVDYESLVANMEFEHADALSKEMISLDEKKKNEVQIEKSRHQQEKDATL